MSKYLVICDDDMARVQNQNGKVLAELPRTCPLCGRACDIIIGRKMLTRKCKHCDRMRQDPIKD